MYNQDNRVSSASDYKKQIDRAKKILFLVLILSVVVYFIFSIASVYYSGIANFSHYISSIKWYYFVLALLVVFASDVVAAPKWFIYTKKLGIKIAAAKNFALYMSLNSMNITPGRWGRSIASYLIKKMKGIRFASTFPAVVADLFTDFGGFGIVLIIFAFLIHKYVIISVVVVAAVLIPYILLFSKRFYLYIRKKLARFKKLRSLLDNGEHYFVASKKLGTRAYLYSLIFTVPSNLLSGLSLYFIMLAFGIHVTISYIPVIMFVYCIATLLGILSGLPGNLGVTEVSLLGLLLLFFKPLGVTFAIASLIIIFTRIATLWWVELYGFGFLAVVMRKKK